MLTVREVRKALVGFASDAPVEFALVTYTGFDDGRDVTVLYVVAAGEIALRVDVDVAPTDPAAYSVGP